MPEDGSRMKAIFADALEFESAEERNAYLKGVCGDDTVLRREVESLLAAHLQADGFLSRAVPELNPTMSTAAERLGPTHRPHTGGALLDEAARGLGARWAISVAG